MGVLLGPVASRTVRTLTRPVNEIWANPKRKFRLVTAGAAGAVPVVTELDNK